MTLKKLIWIRADTGKSTEVRKKIVTTALENNFNDIIMTEEDYKTFKKLGKFNFIKLKKNRISANNKTGEYVIIKNHEDQERAMALGGNIDYVIVSAKNWKVIPFENLIAAYQKTKTKLLVEVTDLKDVKLFFETLEVGVDGIVLNTTNIKVVLNLRELLDKFEVKKLKLVAAKITELKSIGMGDRICIDTCSILNVGEGMLIGSQANGLFLVHSESVNSEYVATRPFRVNAGAVHSYILGPDDKTKYLSDLRAGDEVLVVSSSGEAKPMVIGRLKIERRPLILVEVEYKKKKYNIILQNAETIRLISDNKPLSIVDLNVGDSILIWLVEAGRHFGMKVEENIVEK